LANFAEVRSAFPGGRPPGPPARPVHCGGLGFAGLVPKAAARGVYPGKAPRPPVAGFRAHWPLANFAGARGAFPGGHPRTPVAGFRAHWPLANFAGARGAFPGGHPPDRPRGPLVAGGLGSVGLVLSVPGPPRGLLPPGPVPRAVAGAGKEHPRPRGVRGRGRVGGAGMGPWLAPWPSGPERLHQSRRPVPGWSVRRLVQGRTGGRGSSGDGYAFRRRRRPARGDDEGGGLTAGRAAYLLVTSAAGNGRARHP